MAYNGTKPQGKSTPLSALVGRLTSSVMRRRGFRDVQIIDHWRSIVGAQLASMSLPEGLNHRGKDGAVLTVRVDGAMALEVQHLAPQILERINQFYGVEAVKRLNIIQGPIYRRPLTNYPSAEVLKPHMDAAYDELADLPEGELKQALARLGGRIKYRSASEGE